MTLSPDSASLTDRVAVVTGAAMGIGKATALALARFGADLAICDREAEPMEEAATEIRSLGRRVVTGLLDVRDPERVGQFVDDVSGELGQIDVLVNNAGGTFFSLFMDVRTRGQDALVSENFSSVTHFIRAAVPVMRDGGSIVNVTSIEAHRAAPGFAVYAAMKAAVEQLTRSLALELSDRGIRVNCVAPDAIPTEGDRVLAERVQEGGDIDYHTPLRVGGTPDDCAAAIVFLAGPMSRFVTGTTIHVDGGNDAARGWRRTPDGSWRP